MHEIFIKITDTLFMNKLKTLGIKNEKRAEFIIEKEG